MLRIVVCGYMIRMPLAGNVLAFAQYLLGFERLGHSVLYVEESGWPQACFNPRGGFYSDDPIPGMDAVREMLALAGSSCDLAYVDRVNDRMFGMDPQDVDEQISDADLVLNLGGVCWLPAFAGARRLALVDMDPMFTQAGKFAHGQLDQYDAHFTYGTNIGQPDCGIPAGGIDWQSILPPVVPELWQPSEIADASPPTRFTTIANWSAYGSVEWNGESYGQKDRQFLDLLELPRRTDVTLELAVSGMPSKVANRFRDAGWVITDGARVSRSLDDYRSYIWNSAGEFSVAKHGYVKSRSGWISDRTVCYLAAGRPVVVQETGVPRALVARGGWFPFRDVPSAARALETLSSNYAAAQCDAMRLAEEVFSYRRVLSKLLDRVLSLSIH